MSSAYQGKIFPDPMDTKYIFGLFLSAGCQYQNNYRILLIFSSGSESYSGKKQQIDDVVEWLLKGALYHPDPPDIRLG